MSHALDRVDIRPQRRPRRRQRDQQHRGQAEGLDDGLDIEDEAGATTVLRFEPRSME
jgi:hypothetical protein